ncbi:MAG TPA: flagellar hook capping FlgD N-terminal domain-containing protein [Myxococcales bacterium]|nr:flagellar hook capping FlgD N-terminal domain-containing protein [Myxococcales bacterium]
MAITGIDNSSSASTAASSTAQGSNTLGKNDFLKLLMAQLQNQDPTQPSDPTAFTAQLAQFSQLELQQNANDTLSNMATAQASANQQASVNLVGKNVTFSTSTVTIAAAGGALLTGSLSGDANSVSAVIKNSAGAVVRTIKGGPTPQGQLQIPWDGRDDSGNLLAAGSYSVALTALDTQGQAVNATAQSSALVTGVSFSNGVPQLIAGGQTLPLSSITEIDQPIAKTP